MLSPTFSAQTPTPFWKERTRGYANNELSESRPRQEEWS
jgi:hypothetical protein